MKMIYIYFLIIKVHQRVIIDWILDRLKGILSTQIDMDGSF